MSSSPSKGHQSHSEVQKHSSTVSAENTDVEVVDGVEGRRGSGLGESNRSPRRPQAAAATVKQRRWADDVEDDDQFVPIKSAFQRSEALPRRATTPSAPSPKRSLRPRQSEPVGFKKSSTPPALPQVSQPTVQHRHTVAAPSRAELEDIARMKEVMSKKAEERKVKKLEEEAAVEAERRARCEAKLREIEERKKARDQEPSLPPAPTVAAVASEEDRLKKTAFAQKRLQIRERREGKEISTSTAPLSCSTNLLELRNSGGPSTPPPPPVPTGPATRLSAAASEFVPMTGGGGMHHAPPQMQWIPGPPPYGFAPPPYYYPQQPPPFGYPGPYFDPRQQ